MQAKSSFKMSVRPALLGDAPALASLSAQLGYTVTLREIQERLPRYAECDHVLIAVAVDCANRVLGWIQVAESDSLVDGAGIHIQGLVVDQRFRREGIGRQLVEGACNWAKSRGHDQISVRSNAKRKGAHDFYPSLGFERVKTQRVYKKSNLS